jgi:EpsI family protein
MTDVQHQGGGLTRRKFALGLAFASVAGVAAARQPSKKLDYLGKAELEKVIPQRFGDWRFLTSSGLVVPPEDQLSRALYSQLLTRVYTTSDGMAVMLLVAQSATQTGILQIHRPEFCYTAGGYELSPSDPHNIALPGAGASVPALNIAATRNGRTEQIVYWTRIGDRLPTSWPQQRMAVAMDNLRGFIPDAVMVRASTYGQDQKTALAVVDKFLADLLLTLPPQTRRVLIG